MGESKDKSMPKGVECYNCRFFVPTSEDLSYGECRRFPPVYVSQMVHTDPEDMVQMQEEHATTWVWRFPVVSALSDDWCGEFEKHPLATDEDWRHNDCSRSSDFEADEQPS
jgi:hypothetical protein